MTPFQKKVFRAIEGIPRGRVTTYGDVARIVGAPRAHRAVGRALGVNPNLVKVPCHRVVCSDGFLGGYAGGVEEKTRLLNLEGVEIREGRVDLEIYGFQL